MPAKVTLSIIKGSLSGRTYPFEQRDTCLVGRATECNLRLPDDADHKKISRRQCLLDINPPDVRIRDFGSRNGTFVNGESIGQREAGDPPPGAAIGLARELTHGDEIMMGTTTFRVDIQVPEVCSVCSKEIAGRDHPPLIKTAVPIPAICDACRLKAEEERKREDEARKQAALAGKPVPAAQRKPDPQKPKARVCVQCGKDVSPKADANRQGDLLCAACAGDIGAILLALIGGAKAGDKDLVAIKGYQIIKKIGGGGQGEVYLAKHEKSGEQVAIKVMLPQCAVNATAKASFLREMENTKALAHRNVVKLRESEASRGIFFMTLEYCDGGSVDNLMLRRGGVIAVDEAVGILLQALDGLEYAHQAVIPNVVLKDGTIGSGKGLVHRDIKPHNLFLSGTGEAMVVKVGDYGLAKAFDKAGLSGHTMSGAVAGTLQFMPRQQVVTFRYSKPEVDVWGMAASLYYMLTGATPRNFPKGEDPFRVVLDTKPVPIGDRKRSIPAPLAKVIDQALVDKPEIYFKTAADLKRAIVGAM